MANLLRDIDNSLGAKAAIEVIVEQRFRKSLHLVGSWLLR
jgi:hypothetical protein